MDRPVAAALALASLLALAGCVNKADSSGQQPGTAPLATHPIDATAALARADALARAWHEDASLRVVMGTEGVYAQPDDPPYSYDTRNDPEIGDGLALAWTFAYASPSAASPFVVTMGSEDTVLYQHELSQPRGLPPLPHAVTEPFTTSEAAARLILANDTTTEFVSEHPTSFVHMALLSNGSAQNWYYARSTTSGFAMTGIVNATSGALVAVSGGPREAPCCPTPPTRPVMPTPSAPPTPPDENTTKTSTLNAFNPLATFDVAPQHPDFGYAITIAADVPGTSPLDDRTLTVKDASGATVGQKTGTGRLSVDASSADAGFPGGRWHAEVGSQAPPAKDQTITFTARVHYTSYAPPWGTSFASGGGAVSFQQTSDSTLHIPANANATLRVTFTPNGPDTGAAPTASNASTWQLLDPNGTIVAKGDAPSGKAAFHTGAGGSYTLRVTGGADAAFGESYRYSLVAATPPTWM